MLFPLNNDTLILFLVKNFFVQEINVEKRQKPENTQKVPIVVPKIAFLSTFGTTIELFCILKVDDAYQLQENAAIQQIIDNKYLKSFKADRLKVVDPIAKVPGW